MAVQFGAPMKRSLAIVALLVIVLLAAAITWWMFGHHDRLKYHGGGLSFFSDGRKIALGSSRDGDGDIYFLSRDGTALERITTGPPFVDWPAVSPDGKQIYNAMTSTDLSTSQLFSMHPDGSGRERLTSNDWCDVSPSVSSDGKKVIFARAQLRRPYSMGGFAWDNWDVWLMNSDGTAQSPLTHNLYYGVRAPRLSSDGARTRSFQQRHTRGLSIVFMC